MARAADERGRASGEGDDSDSDCARRDDESVVSDTRADQRYEHDNDNSDRDYMPSDTGVSDSSEYSDQG